MNKLQEMIIDNVVQSAKVNQRLIGDQEFLRAFEGAANAMIAAVENRGLIFACGNGGSWSDADHTIGELVGWYNDHSRKRIALPAIQLGASGGALTAIANDTSYSNVFQRQLEGFKELVGDKSVLLAYSTSGNSENVCAAARTARDMNIKVIALTGRDGGRLKSLADYELRVPSDSTARIQEAHHIIYHTLCEIVEKRVQGNKW